MAIRNYRAWVKGRKEETVCVVSAKSGLVAQIKLASFWGVKSFQIECVWIKD